MTVLYKNWDVIKLVPKAPTTPTRNPIALVTVLTIPALRRLPEVPTDLKPKPVSSNRSSPEFHSKPSEAQPNSKPKSDFGSRVLPQVHSNALELQTDSRPKKDSSRRDRSSSKVHAKSLELQINLTQKPNSGEQSSPKVHSEVQIDSNPKLDSGNRSSLKSHQVLPAKLSPDIQPTKQPERRRSLLIYGADRSGTTFTTKMFAEDPQLMTVYEPLWVTTRWNREDGTQIPNWKRNVLDLLTAILSCKFAKSAAGVKFLSHTTGQWSGAYVKNPFKSLAFCPAAECKDLASNPSYADRVCQTKYNHSVTKIGEPRTPDHLISSFLPMIFSENPDTDIRVIQLIRDPRASLNSRIQLGWMTDYRHSNFLGTVRRACTNLAENIRFGRKLDQWQDKYLEVHYRDLAGKPLETTAAMYKFAGFEMPDSIREWVIRNTSPSKEEIIKEAKKIFSPVRNSTANINKWQKEAPIERTRIIEELCTDALDLLGLTKIT